MPRGLNRDYVVKAINKGTDLTLTQSRDVLESLLYYIPDYILSGNSLLFRGVGKLKFTPRVPYKIKGKQYYRKAVVRFNRVEKHELYSEPL